MSDSLSETTTATDVSPSSATSMSTTGSTTSSTSLSSATAGTKTNPYLLGPLTTMFTAPPQCSQAYVYTQSVDDFSVWQGQDCLNGQGLTQDRSCLPPVTASTSIRGFAINSSSVVPQYFGFYSPGISCPAGYTTACGVQVGSDGITSTISGLQSILFIVAATASETIVGCCPTGYQCTVSIGAQQCEKIVANTTLALQACTNGTDGYSTSPTQIIVPLTTYETFSAGSRVLTDVFSVDHFTLYNSMIPMKYKATDLPPVSASTTTPTPSPTPTTTSTGNLSPISNEGGSNNHKATVIAVAVVIPCVALIIAAGLGWFWRRRTARRRHVASNDATQTHIPETTEKTGPSELDSSINMSPGLAADQARFEVVGSMPRHEMAGTDPHAVVHEMHGDMPH